MALLSLLGELFSWGAKSSKSSRSSKQYASSRSSTPRSLSATPTQSLAESRLPPWYTAVERSRFTPACHPRVDEVVRDVDCYFLQHWPFPDSRIRRKFVDAEFTRNMCYNYPEALDDRIGLVCRLITLLFLVDDLLDHMSLDNGRLYNARLLTLMRGGAEPDRSVAAEWMAYDTWESMRACDAALADTILGPMEDFMKAQTEDTRLQKMNMGEYLEWRGRDVGASLVTAVGCFSMGLVLSPEDRALVEPLDRIWFRHVSVINDVWSYDKELRASQQSTEEGAVLCSSVAIMANEARVPAIAAKRTLTHLCREWELQHETLAYEILQKDDRPAIRQYIRGLEHQMSGNEVWSTFTKRYAPPKEP